MLGDDMFDTIFSRFNETHERDRQTDRDRQTTDGLNYDMRHLHTRRLAVKMTYKSVLQLKSTRYRYLCKNRGLSSRLPIHNVCNHRCQCSSSKFYYANDCTIHTNLAHGTETNNKEK